VFALFVLKADFQRRPSVGETRIADQTLLYPSSFMTGPQAA
jgi:hypothetical protein